MRVVITGAAGLIDALGQCKIHAFRWLSDPNSAATLDDAPAACEGMALTSATCQHNPCWRRRVDL
jgi:hypothetical protein